MVNYYKNNQQFIQPFTIYQADGITPVNLTGGSVVWWFKDVSTNPATLTSISGNITNAALGQVSFTVPTSFFTTVTTYQSQLVITIGTAITSTDPPFTVQILLGANLSS